MITKEDISIAKNSLLGALYHLELEIPITVKVKSLTGKNKKYLALYRSGTQFRSNPIFWVNKDFEQMAITADPTCNVVEVLTETLYHEFGHVLFEWANHPVIGDLVTAGLINKRWENEEKFAEDFLHYIRTVYEYKKNLFKLIISKYRRAIS